MGQYQILVADDNQDIFVSLTYLLDSQRHDLTWVSNPSDFISMLRKKAWDLVLLDMNYSKDTTSGKEGLSLLEVLHSQYPDTAVIVMTGWANVDLAVTSLKLGASDFIQKPWNDEHFLHAIESQLSTVALKKRSNRLAHHNHLLTQSLFQSPLSELIAESTLMKQTIKKLTQFAQSDLNILLTGENGTGKSLLASLIHQSSKRQSEPFVSINMGAVPEALFESEMFGHVKGAFTDAKNHRMGRLEMADQGTLFLDEIANLPLSQQAKLLRVLEEKQYEPVGSSQTRFADVRLISATNADLPTKIQRNEFRQDLFYRINAVEIHIPALRDRKEDIIPMAQAFIEKSMAEKGLKTIRISEEAGKALLTYHWPGNVRELKQVMERAVYVCDGPELLLKHLGLMTVAAEQNINPMFTKQSSVDTDWFEQGTLDEINRKAIEHRLACFEGNVTETAKSLGLSRSGYYRRASKYGLES